MEIISSPRTSKSHTEYDSSLDLLKRCRHAAASVGNQIYIYGGLRGEILLDDLLGSDDTESRRGTEVNYYTLEQLHKSAFSNRTPTENSASGVDSPSVPIRDNKGLETLEKGSTADAEEVIAHFNAAKAVAAMDMEGEERPKEESTAATSMCLQKIKSQMPPVEIAHVIKTLFTILRNVMDHLNETKSSCLHKTNPIFQ